MQHIPYQALHPLRFHCNRAFTCSIALTPWQWGGGLWQHGCMCFRNMIPPYCWPRGIMQTTVWHCGTCIVGGMCIDVIEGVMLHNTYLLYMCEVPLMVVVLLAGTPTPRWFHIPIHPHTPTHTHTQVVASPQTDAQPSASGGAVYNHGRAVCGQPV